MDQLILSTSDLSLADKPTLKPNLLNSEVKFIDTEHLNDEIQGNILKRESADSTLTAILNQPKLADPLSPLFLDRIKMREDL